MAVASLEGVTRRRRDRSDNRLVGNVAATLLRRARAPGL